MTATPAEGAALDEVEVAGLGPEDVGPEDVRAGGAGASPFVDFDRGSWAALGENVPLPLTADELARIRSVGDGVGLTGGREGDLPLSRLLTLHVQESGRLYRAYRTFLNAQEARTPF